MGFWTKREIEERVGALGIPFGPFGVDPYGISKAHLALGFSLVEPIYRRYFSVKVYGEENVPARGRGMLVGNHSGGVAIDGMMVVASMFFDRHPPRLAQGMVEKFMNRMPFASVMTSRLGQFTGLPEHAIRLLEDDRLLMVFPEGSKGTAKLFKDRYSLVRFGSGFVRLAMRTRSPIIPFAFLGGGAAIPTIHNAVSLGKLVGAPYVPITPYGVPFPLPVRLEVEYGEPMVFEGTGAEADTIVEGYVEQVRTKIATMIERGRVRREKFADETLASFEHRPPTMAPPPMTRDEGPEGSSLGGGESS